MICGWDKLPENMRNEAVRPYFDMLRKKRLSLFIKRIFDIFLSSILIVIFSPVLLTVAAAVKIDSRGPVFFRQERVTQYGKRFYIFKFRTMVEDAEQRGAKVTGEHDSRITGLGMKLRGKRIDELPQLFDIFRGKMSFVGTRPEVPQYVEHYTDEMLATLLMPSGVTSLTSIYFAEEASLLKSEEDINEAYVKKVLPEKMKWNLKGLREFSLRTDLKIICKTVKSFFTGWSSEGKKH